MIGNGNTYNQPIRSVQTMLHSIALCDGSCIPILPDGIYGPKTASAVTAFQRNQGLPATGITDQNTWDKIVSEYDKTTLETGACWPICLDIPSGMEFGKGMLHPYILIFQCILYTISDVFHAISKPAITGIYDDATVSAIEEFQALCALPQTGKINKQTWDYLASFYPTCICAQKLNMYNS